MSSFTPDNRNSKFKGNLLNLLLILYNNSH